MCIRDRSETVWRQASTFNVPRIAFINKYDRVGADFFNVIETMKDRLDANAVAAQVPVSYTHLTERDLISDEPLFREMTRYYSMYFKGGMEMCIRDRPKAT